MPPLQAKWHKIKSLQQFWNENVPITPYTNEEDMSRAVFGDTAEARQTCIMCYNLRLPSSDGDLLAKN